MLVVDKIMASAVTDKVKECRNRVFLGDLPDDFLRITASIQQQQEAADRQTALALQQQFVSSQTLTPNIVGRLGITVAQAKLAKNYGMTRMDPYVRLRVGHFVHETHTDSNGGKTPRWNKIMQCLLPQGVNTVSLEIYDERSFTMDELIAWTQIQLPPQVLKGETHEDWYPLTGKQGEDAEGMINLVFSFMPQAQSYAYPQPVMMVPSVGAGATPMPVYPAGPVHQPVPVLSENELKMIEEMFPAIDKEVIKSVFEANQGNKDGTINSLLQMSE
ncbi:toll-interacting protein-like [Atheta coriaria]|uniref:toll-interacting protein-like n=1 Tax=Dalotia coriaria TaxID=877792 RepID=UPI0031F455C5